VATDYVAAAFAIVLAVSFLLPVGGRLLQRGLDLRTLGTIPLLYLYGRVFWPAPRSDVVWSLVMIAAAAVLVGGFGLIELWFVPTSTWIALGVPRFNAWLGHAYPGFGGLAPNFFRTTANDILVRRMVSTYLSPLGIAYTGLVVVPIILALWGGRGGGRWVRAAAWVSLILVAVSVVFSLTRLAMVVLVLEVGLLALLLPRPRMWAATLAIAAAAGFGLYGYVFIGPTNHRDLRPIREPVGYALLVGREPAPTLVPTPVVPRAPNSGPQGRVPAPTPTPASESLVYVGDPSLKEHVRSLRFDSRLFLGHPFGLGLGTFVPRFETSRITGESAIFWVIDETGVLGGTFYLALYGLMLLAGWRALNRAGEDWTSRALPLVALAGGLALIPIMATSDLWGDLSVTFLLWWAAGHSASVAGRLSRARPLA
jgi:hypothetical protein